MTWRGIFLAALCGVIIGNAPRLLITEDQALEAGKWVRSAILRAVEAEGQP